MGGRRVFEKSNFFLKNFMEGVGAIDLGFVGNPFMWCNGRGEQANVRERLDRALASSEWCLIYDRAGIIHLTATKSDHTPMLLCLVLDHDRAPRSFRFLEAWIHDPTCELVINTAWTQDERTGRRTSLTAKIQCTAKALKVWNRENFGFCQFKIQDLEKQLVYLQSLDPSGLNISLVTEIQKELSEWQWRLELLWIQKSKELWLRAGDRNSKFFHASTLFNRRRTFIAALKNDGGT